MYHQVSIYDTVSPYVKLKKVGGKYQGLCPFHAEKTPSFTVYPDTNHYHCFGCKAHGDAITFEMNYHGLTFPQAGDKLGLELDHSHNHHNSFHPRPQPKPPRLSRVNEAKELENARKNREREIRLHKNTPEGKKSTVLESRQVEEVAGDYRVFLEPYGRFSGVKCTAFLLTNINENPRGLQKLYHITGKNYKKFTKGLKLKGACYIIKPDEITDQTVRIIIICEGIVTGLSLKKAFPHAWIYCALTASNLPIIAQSLRQQNPKALIYIACDNDDSGTGLLYGDEAAQKSRGRLVIPSQIGEDFNDVLVKRGVSGIQKYFVKNELDWPKILRGETPSKKMLGTPSISHYISKSYPRLSPDECLSSYLTSLGAKTQFSERSLHLLKERAAKKIQNRKRVLMKQLYDFHEDLENVTLKYFSEKYIPNDFVMDASINLLTGGMGSGKTQLMKRDAATCPDQAQLFYLAPITNLVQTSAQELGFTHYQNEKEVYQSKRIATTLHSLYKFDVENLDTLYIDEIEQILKIFPGKAIKNHEKIFEAFCQALRKAKRLVIADAFLSPRTLRFLRYLRPNDPIQWLAPSSERRPDGKGQKLRPYWGRQGQEALIQLVLNQLKLNKRVLIPTSSKKLSQQLITLIQQKFPEKKGLVINGETSHDQRDFILNINQQIDDYDYVIYTPSFSVGVSINESVKPFDLIAAFIYGSIGTWPDAWQLIARYRKHLDLHVWIQNYTNSSPTDSKNILNSYLQARKGTEKYTSTFRAHYTDKLLQAHIEGQVYQPNDFDLWFCEIEAQQNEFSKDFANNFLLMGELRGYEIVYSSTPSPEMSFDWTTVKNSHESLRVENLMTAPSLTEKEFETLKNQPGLTEPQHHQMERFALEAFYHQKISESLIRYDNDGNKRQQIRTLELANRRDDYLIKKDLEEQDTHSVVLNQNRILKKKFLLTILSAVGLRFEADGSLSGEGRYFNISDPKIQNVLKQVDQNRELIDGLKIGKTRQDLLTNLQWFLSLLKNLGVNVTHKKVKGNRYYCIVISSLSPLNKHLIKRYNRFLERYCKELALDEFNENNEITEMAWGAAQPKESINKEGGAPQITAKNLLNNLINQLREVQFEKAKILEVIEAFFQLTPRSDFFWSDIVKILVHEKDYFNKLIDYLVEENSFRTVLT